LIDEASAGGAEALAFLLEHVRPAIYQWATARTRDRDDAEDVTQLVLVRLWTGLPNFRRESRLAGWIYRITMNEAFGHRRRHRIRELKDREWAAEVVETLMPSDSGTYDGEALEPVVRDMACALPPLQQAAFRLVDLDGMRPCEAAKALGRTETNTRSSLCRARKKIRNLVRQARRALVEDLVSGGP
jgi:RNA polymerase sigma-70 factor (ECF subfamily)